MHAHNCYSHPTCSGKCSEGAEMCPESPTAFRRLYIPERLGILHTMPPLGIAAKLHTAKRPLAFPVVRDQAKASLNFWIRTDLRPRKPHSSSSTARSHPTLQGFLLITRCIPFWIPGFRSFGGLWSIFSLSAFLRLTFESQGPCASPVPRLQACSRNLDFCPFREPDLRLFLYELGCDHRLSLPDSTPWRLLRRV